MERPLGYWSITNVASLILEQLVYDVDKGDVAITRLRVTDTILKNPRRVYCKVQTDKKGRNYIVRMKKKWYLDECMSLNFR